MLDFGVGDVFGNPVGGNTATPSSPTFFGSVQDISVEISEQQVELRGQSKGPDDVAPGDMDVKGKASFARKEIQLINSLFLGDTITSGIKIIKSKEALSIPASPGPYTVTVTNSANFSTDLGVMKASDLTPFVKVASGPTTGQYSVSAGVYTFAAADQTIAVLISYSYSNTGGSTLTATNQRMGYGPIFELWCMEPYQGTNGLHLYQCRVTKFGLPFKRNGYMMQDFEFVSWPNSSSNWFDFFQISA